MALLAVAVLAGWARTIRTGALIDQYSRADCVPVRFISRHTRAWDYTLKTREGITVRISGVQMPGGRIDVRYMPDGKVSVAANAGDYIYPADVRFDATVRPDGKVWHGPEGARRAMTEWVQEWDEYELQTERVLGGGDAGN